MQLRTLSSSTQYWNGDEHRSPASTGSSDGSAVQLTASTSTAHARRESTVAVYCLPNDDDNVEVS
jgi:hypothetical protein